MMTQDGARLVALTLDDSGLPTTAAQRVAIATRLGEAAQAAGIALSDLFIDPLARSIAIYHGRIRYPEVQAQPA